MTAQKDAASRASEYAMEQSLQQNPFAGIFDFGLGSIQAATQAIAAANETQALSVDPNVVDAMIKKLNDMKDTLDKTAQQAMRLGRETKLGGGYAQDVAQANRQLGTQVLDNLIPETQRAIDELKTQIEKSRASYQNVEEGRVQTFNKLR